jgi:hypothetical protein
MFFFETLVPGCEREWVVLSPSRITVSSKNTKFSGSIFLIFSQYSTLNFWTLSVAAWLVYHVFFYDWVLIFVAQRHIAVRLTQFPLLCPNNSHNSTKVASRCSATSALTNASPFVKWLNCGFPLCLGCKFPSVCCCSCLFLDETFALHGVTTPSKAPDMADLADSQIKKDGAEIVK